MVCLIRYQTELYTGQDFSVLALVCGSASKRGAGELKCCSDRFEKAKRVYLNEKQLPRSSSS